MTILVSSYIHPEYYPPSLNAIDELSAIADKVIVLTRKLKKADWEYASNVQLIELGPLMNLRESESLSTLTKVKNFFLFCREQKNLINQYKPDVVLLYDVIALYSFARIRKRISHDPTLVWYHNHDVSELSHNRPFSIGWWATRGEGKMFPHLDVFSLPSIERKKFFPISHLKGKFFHLPNYPSLRFYSPFTPGARREIGDSILLIYQGNLGEGHAFENLIPLLGIGTYKGKKIMLTLIGPIHATYAGKLKQLAKTHGVQNYLNILPPVSFNELPAIAMKHHIGLAIHTPGKIIYNTGGTASNKIYEYMAMGMPVILFDHPHYRQHLGNQEWAFFTDCSKNSLCGILDQIMNNYPAICGKALTAFHDKLNFNYIFEPVKFFLQREINGVKV